MEGFPLCVIDEKERKYCLIQGWEEDVRKVVTVKNGDVANHFAEFSIHFVIRASELQVHLDTGKVASPNERVKSILFISIVENISLWIEIKVVVVICHEDSCEHISCHCLELAITEETTV